ncbi:MAG TPA: cupredoxin family copper-binding protein [Anaerolineae bacterium]|nr:cupredoxin family copper-binding protein [Anaerolineae bacterium]
MATSMSASPAPVKKKNRYTHLWNLIGITVVLGIIAVALGVQLKVPGFLGTRATTGAGLAVILEIAGLIALWIGRGLARKKDFYHHQRVQTAVMLFNIVVILFVMVVTFSQQVVGPGAPPNDPVVLIEIGHGISGVLLQLLGLYIVVRMWFEKVLPQWFLFKNFRLLMLTTLFWWTLQTLGGVGIFAMRYLTAAPAAAPIVSTAPTAVAAVATAIPQPTLAPVPTAVPTQPPVTGSAAARDDQVHSDSLLIRFQDVPQPASGEQYVGWLIGNGGEFRLRLGTLKVDADGKVAAQYTSPKGSNLLGLYNEFLISTEAAGSTPTAPSDKLAFSVIVPPKARASLNQLLVDAPDTPFNTGYLLGLLGQGRRVVNHAELAMHFADKNNLKDVQRQAELIVNLIEGELGANFGDVDGDGRVFNDGNGIGIFPRSIDKVKQVAQAAIDASDATESIKLHMGHTIIGVDNVIPWAQQIDALALALAKTKDLAEAKKMVVDLNSLAQKLLQGVDLNNDETIDPVKGEGTIEVAYKHAQFAASPVYNAPLVVGGAPLVVAEVTPTPAPTQPPAPTAGPQAVSVALIDFAFDQPTLTIKVGTTVSWINRDPAPHTITFDDGSFDSGTLAQGQTASFTFDKAGEFAYYCLFHGGPGGVGMTAKVIVAP